MKYWLILLPLIGCSGCTNYLYQGKTTYAENGKQCDAMVYWNNTTHLFNSDGKPSSVVVRNASNPSSFTFSDQRDDELTLILPSDEYRDVINQTTGDTQLVCGKFEGKQAHEKGLSNRTSFTLYCDKQSHPLKPAPTGMKANSTPYVFEMQEPVAEFSLLGKEIKATVELQCR